ncbi:MAG TPA: heparinase II/III family protein, partial [Blastocatellia bacterium]|nr:heparinase II/III family protein [Blastocatellia bacterium]
MLEKLKTLKGRSLDELRVRSVQALAALGEQYAWAEQARLPRDAELIRSLNGACKQHRITCTDSLFDYFRGRTSPSFFAAFDDPAATLAELRSRWPQREQIVIAEAERAAQGRFRLLGFDELDFGMPVDWHLEPVSGKRAPLRHWSRVPYLDAREVGDKKITWELNRCQHFATLGQAYWYTGDERHAETFVAHLTGWMDANPPKLGINWASSLEVAFRAISWLWGLQFFRRSPRLTAEVFSRALKFLYLHARHLETYLSTYFSPNTHLTGEALGLFYLGLMLPEFHCAKRRRALGWKILLEQLDHHVRPDGIYFEQASHYHRYTTDFYLHLLTLARRNGRPREIYLEEKLRALLDHLMHLTRPDGTTPQLGDDDGGQLLKLDGRKTNDFRATLATGAALFGRGDYKFVAGEAAEETLWLLGPEGLREFDRSHPAVPAHLSLAFPNGGIYSLRDGWARQSSSLLLDCGPHGALSGGHAHADALSFEFAANGATWLIDPGTFTYTGDAAQRD